MRNFDYLSTPSDTNFIGKIGFKILEKSKRCGVALLMSLEAIYYFKRSFRRRHEITRQIVHAGTKNIFIVSLVALFTGMILALQSGLALQQYGNANLVGVIVVETICREMGPFMTSLILAAAVGSAYAAQVGTMKISEELSALRIMNINPIDYLVMPRMIALLLSTPILTLFANIIACLGGMLIAYTQFNVSYHIYWDNALEFLTLKTIYIGLFKSIIFAFIIVSICCYKGFTANNGAVGVGLVTRQSVVYSFIYILIFGYFITWIFS